MKYYYYLLHNTRFILDDGTDCYLIVRVKEDGLWVRRIINKRLGFPQKIRIEDMRQYKNRFVDDDDRLMKNEWYTKRANDLSTGRVMLKLHSQIPLLKDVVLKKEENVYYVIGCDKDVYEITVKDKAIISLKKVTFSIELLQYEEVYHLNEEERNTFCIKATLMNKTR